MNSKDSPDKNLSPDAKAVAGKFFFSPALPLLLLSAGLAGLLLCLPQVQTAIVQLGEKIAGRQLTQEVWFRRFSAWGQDILTCIIPALLSWAVLFAYLKIYTMQKPGWPQLFAGLGLWVLLYAATIPFGRTQRILVILAATVLCLILLKADHIVRSSGTHADDAVPPRRAGNAPADISSPVRPGTRGLLLTVLPALTAVLLAALFIDRGQTWGYDFAEYIAQAGILAGGQDNPARPQVGYQYGTALLLLPFYKIWDLKLIALKVPMILCFAVFIISISFFYRKRMQFRNAAVATFLIAVSPALITYLNNVLSDIPFLLFSTLSVICFYGVYDRESGSVRQCLSAAAAGFCVMYAYSCRFQGIILLMTFASTGILLMLRAAMKKNSFIQSWADSLGAGGILPHICFYASFALFYALYKLLLPASPGRSDLGFFDSFSLTGLACNAVAYPFFFSEFFACHDLIPKAIRIAVYLAALPLIVLGIIRTSKKEAVCVIYSLGLLAVYVIWPGPRDFRFLFPILPFMLLFAVYGYEALADTGLRRCYKVFFLLTACIFFCVMLCLGAGNLRRGRSGNYQAFSEEATAAYSYIRENTGKDEGIIFFKPRVLYLATGRVSAEAEEKEDDFILQLEKYDYILEFSGQPHGFPLPLKEGLPQGISLEEAFSNASFTLCRIRRAVR